MSALHRLLNLPASRRSYSSFFSSKSGGGRYFNSAKPPNKNAVVATKNNSKPDSSTVEGGKDGVQKPAIGANATSSQSPLADTQPPTSRSSSPAADSSSPSSHAKELPDALAEFRSNHIPQLAVSSKDLNTHQFFSLHRPLLLISQPASIFRSIPPNCSIFSTAPPAESQGYQNIGFDDPMIEPSMDADAEAARQLTRALTMNQAGATISWENTLRHLGLDVSKEADRVDLQKQFDKEWEDVRMDSTKRKRRKKMKKHKLKKRRRATRSERLRLK